VSRHFRLPFRSRSRIDSEIDEELAFHLANVAARLRAEGWSQADADAEARRRFGDVEFTKSYCRDADLGREQERNRMTLVDELGQDLRYAFRSLRSSVGFTAIALATLALGIGANTAIFSVVRAVLLEPLPFATPDRLVRFWAVNETAKVTQGAFSEPDFLDIQSGSRLAESIGGYFFADGATGLDLTGNGAPERISAALVTPGFFETLRPTPLIGRVLARDEHPVGNNKFVVLGYGFWERRFGGDRGIVGRPITLNGDAYTVVGVMRPEFTYPAAQTLDAWIPLSNFGPDAIGRVRAATFLSAIARLKPGVTLEQFRGEVAGIMATLARTYSDNPNTDNASARTIRESIVGDVQRPLLVLVAAVSMVLLITCVNIASLLLARASTRERELAVRAALGAGRGRIVRQLLTESLTLALTGGVLGAILGYVAVRALAVRGATQLPGLATLHMDGVILAYTLGISVVAGILFGALPAVRAAGPVLEQSLRSGGRGSVGAGGQRLRGALVITEVALAVVLASGASLATKSFSRLLDVKPGFDPSHALVARISIAAGTPAAMAFKYESMLDAVRRVPGVIAAGSIRDLPTRGNGESLRPSNLGLAGQRPGDNRPIQLHHVSPDFFKAMGIPMRGGRDFTTADDGRAPVVLVANEAAANRFWPGQTAVGQILHLGKTEVQIIGVVGNIRQRGLSEDVEPTFYISALQNMRIGMSIVARTNGDPQLLANAVRNAIWSVDRNQTITEVTTMEAVLGKAVARPQLLAWLLGIFGFIGLLLGALGLYGLLAFTVAQRRQEIGVRAALGASPGSVLRLIMGQGMALAIAGVVLGAIAARLLTQQMQGVLFGIAPNDVMTLAEVVMALVATAAVASWLPARRAVAIDPVTALRAE
jgi:predicted permease